MSGQQNTLRYFSLFILTLQVRQSLFAWVIHLTKYLSFQTTVTVLAMRYSRKQTEGGKELYIATTLILVSELIKFAFCLILLLIQKSGSFGQLFKTVTAEVIFKPWETAKLAIPSSLYTIQNNLILLALSSLDAATFQVSTFSYLNIYRLYSLSLKFPFHQRKMFWCSFLSLTGDISVENFNYSFLFRFTFTERNQSAAMGSTDYFDGWCCPCSGKFHIAKNNFTDYFKQEINIQNL